MNPLIKSSLTISFGTENNFTKPHGKPESNPESLVEDMSNRMSHNYRAQSQLLEPTPPKETKLQTLKVFLRSFFTRSTKVTPSAKQPTKTPEIGLPSKESTPWEKSTNQRV
jgi:hypothetical protein